MPGMYDTLIVFVHLIVTVVRLIKPGGLRAVVAESVLTRHQILISLRGIQSGFPRTVHCIRKDYPLSSHRAR